MPTRSLNVERWEGLRVVRSVPTGPVPALTPVPMPGMLGAVTSEVGPDQALAEIRSWLTRHDPTWDAEVRTVFGEASTEAADPGLSLLRWFVHKLHCLGGSADASDEAENPATPTLVVGMALARAGFAGRDTPLGGLLLQLAVEPAPPTTILRATRRAAMIVLCRADLTPEELALIVRRHARGPGVAWCALQHPARGAVVRGSPIVRALLDVVAQFRSMPALSALLSDPTVGTDPFVWRQLAEYRRRFADWDGYRIAMCRFAPAPRVRLLFRQLVRERSRHACAGRVLRGWLTPGEHAPTGEPDLERLGCLRPRDLAPLLASGDAALRELALRATGFVGPGR